VPARLSKAEQGRFLRGRHVAVLVTIGDDGAPVPSPIWYLYRDGAFYFRTADDAIKTKNVRRDPRVSVCVQDERPPYRAITAYGRAEIAPADDGLEDELPSRYLGLIGAIGYKRTAVEDIQRGRLAVTLVVRPDRVTSFDFTPETPVYGRWWLMLKRVLPPWL
jgi:PPOX class probable F420-dependent enzyme